MNIRLTSAALIAGATLISIPAHAYEFNTLNTLSQPEFRLLSEDVSAALSYKPMIPAADMGLTGFDLGLSVSGTHLAHREVVQKATGGASVPADLPAVGLRIHKGLPFNLNIGASYTNIPGTPLSALGGELRWAFMPGSALMPAVAARLSLSSTTGLNQLKMHSTGYDISISKGFTVLTPYAGIGYVESRVSAPESPALSSEKVGQTKYFGGVNMNLGLMNVALEGDRTGKTSTYGVKFGFRF